ncbi:uncharacterized protein VTP21DRAFT_8495 [Calcarisporiella thermophila]|uniref:uncharacterized protein n=1 Tax=Calcarisporiella thermophila TaxID=911321 RepID=UPI003743D7A4
MSTNEATLKRKKDLPGLAELRRQQKRRALADKLRNLSSSNASTSSKSVPQTTKETLSSKSSSTCSIISKNRRTFPSFNSFPRRTMSMPSWRGESHNPFTCEKLVGQSGDAVKGEGSLPPKNPFELLADIPLKHDGSSPSSQLVGEVSEKESSMYDALSHLKRSLTYSVNSIDDQRDVGVPLLLDINAHPDIKESLLDKGSESDGSLSGEEGDIDDYDYDDASFVPKRLRGLEEKFSQLNQETSSTADTDNGLGKLAKAGPESEEAEEEEEEGDEDEDEMGEEKPKPDLDERPRLLRMLQDPEKNHTLSGLDIDKFLTTDIESNKREEGGLPKDQGSEKLPFDWTLKTFYMFRSFSSFAWCEDGRLRGIRETDGLEKFIKGEPLKPISKLPTNPTLIHQQEFEKCLYHYEYPASDPSPMHITLMTRLFARKHNLKPEEKEEMEHYFKLEEEWQQSFQSLYWSLRNQKCPYFYYINQEFSVLFLSPEMQLSREPMAILNRSTVGLRHALEREGIEFSLPFHKQKHEHILDEEASLDEGEAEKIREDLEELESLQRNSTLFGQSSNKHIDNTEQSLLHFRGHLAVHSLFNFLFNWHELRSENRARGCPKLISPCAFLNASLKRATIVKNNSLKTTGNEIIYRLDIRGILLPSSLHYLGRLFSVSQRNEWSCGATSDDRTLGFRMPPDAIPEEQANLEADRTQMYIPGVDELLFVDHSIQIMKCNGGRYFCS